MPNDTVIYKYGLTDHLLLGKRVEMPVGAKVISTALQRGEVCVWAEVPLSAIGSKMEERRFEIIGTGMAFPRAELGRFIGTILMHGDDIVVHVFESIS